MLWRRCNRLQRKRSVDGKEDGESAVRVVEAAESVEEGTVRVVDRSLLTTSEAVAVLELSKCGGRSVTTGGWWKVPAESRVASVEEALVGGPE